MGAVLGLGPQGPESLCSQTSWGSPPPRDLPGADHMSTSHPVLCVPVQEAAWSRHP